MSRQAIKFTNLDGFLSAMDQQGFGKQAQELIYEGEKLPYCSAYLLPLELLPSSFDLARIDAFAGTVTRVQEINYLGTEQFFTDFMVYPLSMTGFVEVDEVSAITFAADQSAQEQDWTHMTYVINLEDGGGQEFFLTMEGSMINLSTVTQEQPQEFKTIKLVSRKMDQIRDKYPATCRIYCLERREFDRRQSVLQPPKPDNE